jgi:hypothetical protein
MKELFASSVEIKNFELPVLVELKKRILRLEFQTGAKSSNFELRISKLIGWLHSKSLICEIILKGDKIIENIKMMKYVRNKAIIIIGQ